MGVFLLLGDLHDLSAKSLTFQVVYASKVLQKWLIKSICGTDFRVGFQIMLAEANFPPRIVGFKLQQSGVVLSTLSCCICVFATGGLWRL